MNRIVCSCNRIVDEIAYCECCEEEVCTDCAVIDAETDKAYCSKCADELDAMAELLVNENLKLS